MSFLHAVALFLLLKAGRGRRSVPPPTPAPGSAPKVTRPVSLVSRPSTTTAGGICFDFLDAGQMSMASCRVEGLERRARS